MSEVLDPPAGAREPGNRREPTFDPVVRELLDHHRSQASGHASRATLLERERDEARTALEAAKTERETALAEAGRKADERVIRAELKAKAKAAGLIDLRDLAALDVSKLKLTDAGDVEGADDALAKFRTERPHLFAGGGNTSSTSGVPPESAPSGKSAMQMTPEEYQAARAAKLSRR